MYKNLNLEKIDLATLGNNPNARCQLSHTFYQAMSEFSCLVYFVVL